MFAGTPLGLAGGAVFTLLLSLAAAGDLWTRRIPNKLVALLAILGFGYSVAVEPLNPGVLRGAAGFLVGLACWLPFYAVGWLGAGDVKLFAAAGTWLGPLRTFEGALIAALAGAALALAWMIWTYGLRRVLTTLSLAASVPSVLAPSPGAAERRKTLPYGVALAGGALAAAWLPGLLLQ